MNDEKKVNSGNAVKVDYIVFEGELARAERYVKRIWVALIVTIIAFFASNIAWLYYESQFETVSYSQDGEGLNNINTGEQGSIYGTDPTDQEAEERQE